MKKVVGFGDYILRLSPEGYLKFIQTDRLVTFYTGAEANVLTSLSYMGVPTQFVTRLPENEISECALATLNKYKVGTDYISFGGERIGIFFASKGASQRPSTVVYDRKNSSFCNSRQEDFDWEEILRDAGYFHFTGITLALGDNLAEICLQACKTSKKLGVVVSCDFNYRKNLWSRDKAIATMEKFLDYVDILIAGGDDIAELIGLSEDEKNIILEKPDYEGHIDVARRISEKYSISTVATTLRESISASDNDWAAFLYQDGNAYFSKKYHMHIVDRIGGGDSFGAGILYAANAGFDAQTTIEYATAASCLKHSIELDVNLSKPEEILDLANGDGSGRIKR